MLCCSLMDWRSKQDTTPQISRSGAQQHHPCLLTVMHCMQGKHQKPQQPSDKKYTDLNCTTKNVRSTFQSDYHIHSVKSPGYWCGQLSSRDGWLSVSGTLMLTKLRIAAQEKQQWDNPHRRPLIHQKDTYLFLYARRNRMSIAKAINDHQLV